MGGFLTSERDALEAFEFAHGLLDTGSAAIERLGKECRLVLGIRLDGDDGADATLPSEGAIGFAVIAFVADGGARHDLRPEVEQDREVSAVAGLSWGQIEGDGQAGMIGLEVDLGREAATRAAEGLAILPPFAPAAETWARAVVESNI